MNHYLSDAEKITLRRTIAGMDSSLALPARICSSEIVSRILRVAVIGAYPTLDSAVEGAATIIDEFTGGQMPLPRRQAANGNNTKLQPQIRVAFRSIMRSMCSNAIKNCGQLPPGNGAWPKEMFGARENDTLAGFLAVTRNADNELVYSAEEPFVGNNNIFHRFAVTDGVGRMAFEGTLQGFTSSELIAMHYRTVLITLADTRCKLQCSELRRRALVGLRALEVSRVGLSELQFQALLMMSPNIEALVCGAGMCVAFQPPNTQARDFCDAHLEAMHKAYVGISASWRASSEEVCMDFVRAKHFLPAPHIQPQPVAQMVAVAGHNNNAAPMNLHHIREDD